MPYYVLFSGVNCEIKLEIDPCKPNMCKSGSTCTPRLNGGFICEDCSPAVGVEHYTSLCELRTRSFMPSSFLTFPGLKQRHRLHIQLKYVLQTFFVYSNLKLRKLSKIIADI